MFQYQVCLLVCLKLILTNSEIHINNAILSNVSSRNDHTLMGVAEGIKDINIEDEDLSKNTKDHQTVRHAFPYVVPRKGVNLSSFSTARPNDELTTVPIPIISTGLLSLNSKNSSTLKEQLNTNTTVKKTEVVKQRFNPKPTATIVNTDGNSKKSGHHAAATRTPPLGMPSKITYVGPVMITILVLPLIIFLGFYTYKHGRDCWSKRHYRRMDFLIDGMYNE